MKTILKQDSKSRKEDQNANQPGSSSNICRCCCFIVAPLSHCCLSVFAPMLHRYRSTVALILSLLLLLLLSLFLSLLLSLQLSLRSRSCYRLRCRSAVAPLLLCCRSAVSLLPLLSLRCRCCLSCCCYAVTADIAPAVTHGRHLKR